MPGRHRNRWRTWGCSIPVACGTRRKKKFSAIGKPCPPDCASAVHTWCSVVWVAWPNDSLRNIVTECRELVARGAKEITLLGQIVTSYGKREIGVKDGKSAFVRLLEAVHEIERLERIRFTSPHPKGYGDDLVEAYARLPKLVESAHIPVQSGSNQVLKRMHRGYTRERFLEIIDKLRQGQPPMGITTDFIVGFSAGTES